MTQPFNFSGVLKNVLFKLGTYIQSFHFMSSVTVGEWNFEMLSVVVVDTHHYHFDTLQIHKLVGTYTTWIFWWDNNITVNIGNRYNSISFKNITLIKDMYEIIDWYLLVYRLIRFWKLVIAKYHAVFLHMILYWIGKLLVSWNVTRYVFWYDRY